MLLNPKFPLPSEAFTSKMKELAKRNRYKLIRAYWTSVFLASVNGAALSTFVIFQLQCIFCKKKKIRTVYNDNSEIYVEESLKVKGEKEKRQKWKTFLRKQKTFLRKQKNQNKAKKTLCLISKQSLKEKKKRKFSENEKSGAKLEIINFFCTFIFHK